MTDAPAPDPVAARLAEIRQRRADTEYFGIYRPTVADLDASAEDVPDLLRLADAVLALHQPGRVMILGHLCGKHEAHRHFSITSTEADAVRACPECTATVFTPCARCSGRPAWPCAEYRAVSSALLGEGDH